MRTPVTTMFALAGTWLLSAALLDRYGHRDAPSGKWDAIVVAGCRALPSGRPSPALERRTARAVALWRAGLAPRIVLTGGVDAGGTVSEAHAAAEHAHALGVPRSALLLEARSRSTEENARFAAPLVGRGRVLVVSDTYHVFRCERVFRRYFAEARGVGAPTRLRFRAVGALREVAAVAAYAAFGRLS